jgi:hypothetical protein
MNLLAKRETGVSGLYSPEPVITDAVRSQRFLFGVCAVTDLGTSALIHPRGSDLFPVQAREWAKPTPRWTPVLSAVRPLFFIWRATRRCRGGGSDVGREPRSR